MSPRKEGYVPDGFTQEEWRVQKYKDSHKPKIKHFTSRSLQSFQEEFEKGRLRHLFPVMFAKKRIARHEIHPRDIPYMQRIAGSFDNSDINVGYVPDGMTPHQWHDIQRKEDAEKTKKDYRRYGIKGFKSRSLQSFQEDLAKGKVSHLMPKMYAKQRVKAGLLKQEEVPYMQRGGNWDNSDVKGAQKLEWSETDKRYESEMESFEFPASSTGAKKPVPEKKKQKKTKRFFGLFT